MVVDRILEADFFNGLDGYRIQPEMIN